MSERSREGFPEPRVVVRGASGRGRFAWLCSVALVLAVQLGRPSEAGSKTLAARPHGLPHAPRVKVLPWNGHQAALTLTFDDASPSEADLALPALDARGVKATFFVTEKNAEGHEAAWALAAREGHELGNHTVDHCSSAELGMNGCLGADDEIDRCTDYIEQKLGAPDVYTFAYPFVDARGGYRALAPSKFLLARAGAGGLVTATSTPDWYAMDAKFIEPSRGQTVKDWTGWIDDATPRGDWLVLVFHSILPETWCEGVSASDLDLVLEHAETASDLWVDTFVHVGGYLRAQRMFESVAPAWHGGELVWRWALPAHFPPDRSLRVAVDAGSLYQAGRQLPRDAHGTFSVALDPGSVAWRP